MGNIIVYRCSCCDKESLQLISECRLSDLEDNDKSMIREKMPLDLSLISIIKLDNKAIEGVVLLQSSFRQFRQKQKFSTELRGIIEQFDKSLKTIGSFVDNEEMNQRTAYINRLERDKISKPFQLSDKEMLLFPLAFQKEPIKLKDNSIFKGSWNYKGEKHGHGTLYQEDGSKIEGIWRNDCMDGRGRFIDPKGNFFEGQWSKGIVEGEGKYVLANGSKYEGQWKNDLQEGFGKESFLDGSNYEGFYQNGKKEGFGTFTWINGSYYKGSFSESTSKGEGLFRWKNGRQYEGQWENNQLNGIGTFMWPNGKKYSGEYKNNKKEGKGTYYWDSNTYYKGFWLNNSQHGEGEFYCNGLITKGCFRYGKLIKCSSKHANAINSQEEIANESSHRNAVCKEEIPGLN